MGQNFWQRAHFCFFSLLMLCTGYAVSLFVFELQQAAAPAPISVVQDIHTHVPVVHVREINSGRIIGSVGTGARLVIGDDIIVPEADGTFAIAAAPFLTNMIDVEIPAGARYVASRKGKKYYNVESSGGSRIVPGNRVYFQTESEAERAGYRR